MDMRYEEAAEALSYMSLEDQELCLGDYTPQVRASVLEAMTALERKKEVEYLDTTGNIRESHLPREVGKPTYQNRSRALPGDRRRTSDKKWFPVKHDDDPRARAKQIEYWSVTEQAEFLMDLPNEERDEVLTEMDATERGAVLAIMSVIESPGVKRGGMLNRADGLSPGGVRRASQALRGAQMKERMEDDKRDAFEDSGEVWLDVDQKMAKEHMVEWGQDPNQGEEYFQSVGEPLDEWGTRRPKRYGERPNQTHPLHAESQVIPNPYQRGLTGDPEAPWLEAGGNASPHWGCEGQSSGLQDRTREVPDGMDRVEEKWESDIDRCLPIDVADYPKAPTTQKSPRPEGANVSKPKWWGGRGGSIKYPEEISSKSWVTAEKADLTAEELTEELDWNGAPPDTQAASKHLRGLAQRLRTMAAEGKEQAMFSKDQTQHEDGPDKVLIEVEANLEKMEKDAAEVALMLSRMDLIPETAWLSRTQERLSRCIGEIESSMRSLLADSSLGGVCRLWLAMTKAGCLNPQGYVNLMEVMSKIKTDTRLQQSLGTKNDPAVMRLLVQALRSGMQTGEKNMGWEDFTTCLGDVGFGEFSEYHVEDIMDGVDDLSSLVADGLEDITVFLEQLLEPEQGHAGDMDGQGYGGDGY